MFSFRSFFNQFLFSLYYCTMTIHSQKRIVYFHICKTLCCMRREREHVGGWGKKLNVNIMRLHFMHFSNCQKKNHILYHIVETKKILLCILHLLFHVHASSSFCLTFSEFVTLRPQTEWHLDRVTYIIFYPEASK